MTHTQIIANQIIELQSQEDLTNFIEGILTPQELEQVAQRLQIIKMLKKKIPQHQIAEKLGVGIATVTRGSRMLKQGHFNYI